MVIWKTFPSEYISKIALSGNAVEVKRTLVSY